MMDAPMDALAVRLADAACQTDCRSCGDTGASFAWLTEWEDPRDPDCDLWLSVTVCPTCDGGAVA